MQILEIQFGLFLAEVNSHYSFNWHCRWMEKAQVCDVPVSMSGWLPVFQEVDIVYSGENGRQFRSESGQLQRFINGAVGAL